MRVFEKLDSTDKTNLRPVSLLPVLSKVFEKIMYDQLKEYVETFLKKLLCGFRRAHSTTNGRTDPNSDDLVTWQGST